MSLTDMICTEDALLFLICPSSGSDQPRFLHIMLILLIILAFLTAVVFLFIQLPQFGKTPSGERLERIKQSPNYQKGSFKNISHTPDLSEDANYFSVMKEFFFQKNKRGKPADIIPSQKTNLLALPANEHVFIWMGHSSYYLQADGKKILVDPVLSGSASPLPSGTKSFKGTDIYTVDDIPAIDYLFISHDHWDHLDYKTIIQLKPKIKTVICGLGVADHFHRWGFDQNIIVEKDWNELIELEDGFTVNTTTARHFSGRSFGRNKSLWMAYAFKTPSLNIYIGGDSGYDHHFAAIGKQFGPFDIAILECGQYDKSWKYIHMMPHEVVEAAKDLQAKQFIPVHWGKFLLGNHSWDEPVVLVAESAKKQNIPALTPMIGEKVFLQSTQTFDQWWEKVK
jgi:L-ascorbate metabolism protein UlaG (beta-lactamase superfamily)